MPLLQGLGVGVRRRRGASPQTAIDDLLMDCVLPAHSSPSRPFLVVIVGSLVFNRVRLMFRTPVFVPGTFLTLTPFAFFPFAPLPILVWVFGLRHYGLLLFA
jgi:hypothetical protein